MRKTFTSPHRPINPTPPQPLIYEDIWTLLDAHLFAFVYLLFFSRLFGYGQSSVRGVYTYEWPLSKICVEQVLGIMLCNVRVEFEMRRDKFEVQNLRKYWCKTSTLKQLA